MQEPIEPTFEEDPSAGPFARQTEHIPVPNDPPWGTPIAIGMWILSVALIVVVPAMFLAPYLFTRGPEYISDGDLGQRLMSDPTAIAIQILAVIPAHLVTLAAAWMIITNGRKYSFAGTLGWQAGGMRWWHYAIIMAAFFALAIAVGTILPEQENEMLRILKSSRYAVFFVAFMAVVTAPLVEEVIYRGLLYSALQRTVGVGGGVAIVTLLFSFVHLPQYYPSIGTMVLLTVLSLVLTLIRVKTGNLLPCIILHTIFNASQSILLIAEPLFKDGNSNAPVSAIVVKLLA